MKGLILWLAVGVILIATCIIILGCQTSEQSPPDRTAYKLDLYQGELLTAITPVALPGIELELRYMPANGFGQSYDVSQVPGFRVCWTKDGLPFEPKVNVTSEGTRFVIGQLNDASFVGSFFVATAEFKLNDQRYFAKSPTFSVLPPNRR